MSEAITSVTDNEEASITQTNTNNLTKDATSQAGAVQANTTPKSTAAGSGESATGSFSNMAELKREQPEFYRLMMESIGMKICNEMRDHQAKLKKMMREGQA